MEEGCDTLNYSSYSMKDRPGRCAASMLEPSKGKIGLLARLAPENAKYWVLVVL